ncbi:S8 family peptidase [Arthrobacter sp. B10-11]|uniref:S8 family peptidase n=1 Tax=Arthrobacter sp. B10-11 TaxID=3081160 RepID=UPI00295599F7|nr:S8 family peptidase [Arthrobacter sp. B10-11]MDV8147352.1 S8 family peptidase [Arthrobacter sp. B10-11]
MTYPHVGYSVQDRSVQDSIQGRSGQGRSPASRLAAAVALGISLLIGQGLAAPAWAAADPPAEDTASLDAGRYIVMLKDRPLAAYTGGVEGIPGTAVTNGKLDAGSAESQRYSAHLESQQARLAAEEGVAIRDSYTLAVNGFSAELSAAQANSLAKDGSVLAVVKDSLHKIDYSSTEFLGLPGPGGVWAEHFGGEANAGKGTVVGVLDTGYTPGNPFFAGEQVKPLSGAPVVGEPYLSPGNQITMLKADGSTFAGVCEAGDQFAGTECNGKVIGARYYDEAFKAVVPPAMRSPKETFSPLDINNHGSHTASTAAGNSDISQAVGGRDFGKGSGVAPAAKLAIYKVCWEGASPATTGCFASSAVEAIEDAIKDGVDVLSYSISGTNNSTVDPVSIAFLNAAAAGIFVAASAGNSGPAASTVNHAAPWMTSVAASTHSSSLRGTVELSTGQKFAGASIMATEVAAAPIALAATLKTADALEANAALCAPGTLDPAKTAGRIVVCDRGVVDRTAKSLTVDQAGGVGMVLVNLTPNSLDVDLHSVPTVHVEDPAVKEAVAADAALTASLVATDTTGLDPPPVPQIAGFSSRGPTLAANSDLLKPDIAAPGVGVLAAVSPAGHNAGQNFGFLSGTSMAAPHIAGFGALLLGKNPLWSPATVKSAMMTTAYDLVDAEGNPVHDVFAQGAGQVDPARIATPGLVYDAGPSDWLGFLQGQGHQLGVAPVAAKDVNLPSIAIGGLTGTQTVTRTVTALTAGTYSADVDVPGITAVVTPDVLTLEEGGKATFTVEFTNSGATLDAFVGGSLTWSSDEAAVRSPVAIRSVTAVAPAVVNASSAGGTGSIVIPVTSGSSDPIDMTVKGLAKANSTAISLVPGPYTGVKDAANEVQIVNVPAGSSLARFAVNSSNPAADFDLYVVSPAGVLYPGATPAANEAVSIKDPVAGDWKVTANLFASPGNAATAASLDVMILAGDAGNLTLSPNPLTIENGASGELTAGWAGLEAGNWTGLITFGTGPSTQLNVAVTAQ